jgi:PPOX class probable F420-dependent enzyme
MSRRDLIRMTDDEIAAFLDLNHPASLTSIGADGYPHTTAMWFAVLDGRFHFATYAKSQKIVNFARNPKGSVLVEDGDSYDQLRGVLVQGDAELIRDPGLAGDVMVAMTARYAGLDFGAAPAEVEEQVRAKGAKRTVIRIDPVRTVTWDHRKLAGVY